MYSNGGCPTSVWLHSLVSHKCVAIMTNILLWLAIILFCKREGVLGFMSLRRIPSRARTLFETSGSQADLQSSLAVDDTAWNEYMDAFPSVVDKVACRKKCDMEPVIEYLRKRDLHQNIPILDKNLVDSMQERYEEFKVENKFDDNQMDCLTRCLAYIGDYCAKRKEPGIALAAWAKLRESGIKPRERLVSTYLYIFSDGSSPPVDAVVEAATFHDIIFQPNEKTSYLRIKFLVLQGEWQEAQNILLWNDENNQFLQKLRTFMPILEYHVKNGNAAASLGLFAKMRESSGVLIDADAYAVLLGGLASHGYFCQDAPQLDGWKTGPPLLDELMTNMADDLLELSPKATRVVYDGFVAGFAAEGESDSCKFVDVSGKIRLGRVAVDPSSALCTSTGTKLRLFTLTSEQRQQVHDTLLKMAKVQQEEFYSKRKSGNELKGSIEEASRNLNEFSEWLREQPEPFTAIVDGANVGYSGHGDLHYSQIELMVNKLEAMGEKTLVVMPSKYLSKQFFLSGLGITQRLTSKDEDVIQRLQESNRMYKVRGGCLDDYYWMIASVADDRTRSIAVDADTSDNRLPGLRPMLVTNDLMRDHRLALLEERLFRRWNSCHIVGYELSPYEDNEWEDRAVNLSPADFFSREIQGNVCGDGMVWHIPVTSWGADDRLSFQVL